MRSFCKINWMVVLLFLVSCTDKSIENGKNKEYEARFSHGEAKVSIIKLIATPIVYDKKKVEIKGFVSIEFENSAIYLTKEDWEKGIDKNGIWIDLSKEEIKELSSFNKRYVILNGVFDGNGTGHEDNYSGSIKLTKIHILEIPEG